MIRRLTHPLDRYVFAEFWRVFVITALGFPLLVEVLDLAENVDKYVGRALPQRDIAMSYVYWLPESVFLVLPAAVLFATVFTIGSLTRHSEITAAKASGISFHRLMLPIFAGAILATIAGLALGELVPRTNRQRAILLRDDQFERSNDRPRFSYRSEDGRTYTMDHLRVAPPPATVNTMQVERLSNVPGVPNYLMLARSATFKPDVGAWKLSRGVLHVMPDATTDLAMSFDSLVDYGMREQPADLKENSRAPADMGFKQLGRYIEVMERAGADVNPVRVERMLKLAIPVTCIIIVLFGAPLATSTKRGGAAYGIGISLGTTILFLLLINLTKAFGGKAVIEPDLAAWVPSIIFGIFGIILLARVRT